VVAPLQVQSMKYEITLEILKKMASAKTVQMKIFAQNRVENGYTGNFDKRNFNQLKEFIRSLGFPYSM
jgi:hypothetical protein